MNILSYLEQIKSEAYKQGRKDMLEALKKEGTKEYGHHYDENGKNFIGWRVLILEE